MPELILHHYAISPFSEKARLVLGFKRLPWRSVNIPSVLPKPDVMALTGGYRRTPFMQIGADVYCDTALMCRVIERLQPEPTLYPEDVAGLADIVAQRADSALFWIAAPYTLQPAGAVHLMPGATLDTLKAFAADRAAMSPNLKRATLADGAAALQTYFARIENMLTDGRPFLLGALPSIADFSTVQSVWFIKRAPPVATVLASFTRLQAWYERVTAFGHGHSTPMTSAEAIAVAAAGSHAALSFEAEAGLEEGDEVTVTPTDYAHDAVAGRLVGLGADEVVIARSDERAGELHVHFPRIAFQIKKPPTH
ncbi:MAG: glutathione S-transferase family protein [Burkholderiales bacterium]|nr:glutathione S-transferase family protein [Burkholderiales bacterium]